MTVSAGNVVSEMSNEIPPFEVEDLRRALVEAELEDIIDELVEAFLDDAPSRMIAIESAVSAAAGDQIKSSAHAYKSAAASMGAKQLAELLRQMEIAGVECDKVGAAALLPMVKSSHETVMTRLKDAFEV